MGLLSRRECPTHGCAGRLHPHCGDRRFPKAQHCKWEVCPSCGAFGDPSTAQYLRTDTRSRWSGPQRRAAT